MNKAKVAALYTTPEKVESDYIRLLEMAGTKDILDPSVPTIIKPNISWHFFYPAANTTPWQMRGTIKGLKQLGFTDITAVENETVVISPYKGEHNLKFNPIIKEQEIPVLYNCRDEDMNWVPYKPEGEMLAMHKIFPEGINLPDFFFGKNIVHLPTIKCHVYTQMTGAMKNAFGGLINSRRHYTHTWIHETLVDLLTIQKEIHSGILAVMDGTVAGNGPGPRTMQFENKNVILASGDQVAIDAVSSKMMGMDPMKIPCIKIAHDKGLGIGDPREIEIVGDDISGENWNFSVGDNAATAFIKPFWWGFLSPLQKLFFHTPLVYFFVAGSYLFHDYVWYPTKGKKVINDFLKTEWGKKWEEYDH